MVRTSRRSPAVVAVLAVIAMLLMALSPPAGAAPYTADATVAVSTTNPAVGGTLTISLSGFAPNENVALDLHSTVVRLVTVQVDASGSAVVTVQLPPNFRCAHFITATGLTSGRFARVDIFIGPPSGCPGNGNGNGGSDSGNNNSGFGNSGNNNSGFGNSGNNNSGFNNRGDNNSGFNNTGNGSSGFGNGGNPGFANTANTASATDASSGRSGAGAGAAWFILLGLAVVGGAGFLRQRRMSA